MCVFGISDSTGRQNLGEKKKKLEGRKHSRAPSCSSPTSELDRCNTMKPDSMEPASSV